MKKNKNEISDDGVVELNGEEKRRDLRSGGVELDIYDDGEEQINEYYVKISYGIRFFKFLTLTVLVVFVLCMLTAFSDDITAENFQYLMKDLNIELPDSPSQFGHIAYTEDAEQSFEMFKSDLVSVGRQSVEVVNMAGEPVLKSDISYVKPRISAGKSYFLVYDMSGYDFSVYNSFSVLYSETLDYPISDAYMADDGRFAIVTRSDDYRCCVIIYNKSYKPAYTWKTNDKYVFDVILNTDGSFEILAASAENGSMQSYCISGNIRQEQINTVQYGEDIMGLDMHMFENGKKVVFCTDRIVFTDENGPVASEHKYGLDECIITYACDKYAAAVFDKAKLGEDTALCIFDQEGKLLQTFDIEPHPIDVYIYGEYAYVLYDDNITRISLKDGKRGAYANKSGIVRLLQTENGILLAAGKNRAYPIEENEFI